MKKDLEYFREFLEHPETFRHGDFYEMLHDWGEYVLKHIKGYAKSDEWKEVRDRMKADYKKRRAIAPKLLKEYERMCRDIHSIPFGYYDDRVIEILRHAAEFQKKYRAEFRYSDEDIREAEEDLRLSIMEYEAQKAYRELQRRAEIKLRQDLKKSDASLIVPFKARKKLPEN